MPKQDPESIQFIRAARTLFPNRAPSTLSMYVSIAKNLKLIVRDHFGGKTPLDPDVLMDYVPASYLMHFKCGLDVYLRAVAVPGKYATRSSVLFLLQRLAVPYTVLTGATPTFFHTLVRATWDDTAILRMHLKDAPVGPDGATISPEVRVFRLGRLHWVYPHEAVRLCVLLWWSSLGYPDSWDGAAPTFLCAYHGAADALTSGELLNPGVIKPLATPWHRGSAARIITSSAPDRMNQAIDWNAVTAVARASEIPLPQNCQQLSPDGSVYPGPGLVPWQPPARPAPEHPLCAWLTAQTEQTNPFSLHALGIAVIKAEKRAHAADTAPVPAAPGPVGAFDPVRRARAPAPVAEAKSEATTEAESEAAENARELARLLPGPMAEVERTAVKSVAVDGPDDDEEEDEATAAFRQALAERRARQGLTPSDKS